MRTWYALGVLLTVLLMVSVVWAQPMEAKDVAAWTKVINTVPSLYKALKSRDAMPLLSVLCGFITALLKTKWFQSVLQKVTMRKSDWELTDAGKTFMALTIGILFTWFVAPASTEVRTLGKGVMVGTSAIGAYHIWKHTLRDFLFKPKTPEVQQDACQVQDDDIGETDV